MVITYILFFLVTVTVITGSGLYIRQRLINPMPIRKPYKRVLALGVLATPLMVPVIIMIRKVGVGGHFFDLFAWMGYLGFGFLSFVLTYLLVSDAVRLISRAIGALFNRKKTKKTPQRRFDPDRRRMLADMVNIGIVSSALVSTAYGFSQARRLPVVKTVVLPFRGLPQDGHGFRIAQISDIHVSETIKQDWVRKVVGEVNRLEPDMVAFTGDLADGAAHRLTADAAPLADLRAPLGKFFVTGNHEYYSGAEKWVNLVRRLGFTVLTNEHRVVQKGNARLLIGGVTDYRAGRFIKAHASDPHAAIAHAPSAHLKILLAHQPKSIFEASRAGFDLQLSGHTHGGQFFPWNYAIDLVYPFKAGLYHVNNTRMYVNRGTGYWGPPVRLGSPSEITLFKLKKM